MITLAVLLDVILVLVLLTHIVYGYSVGLVRPVGASLGALLGAITGYLLTPVIERLALVPPFGFLVIIVLSLALVLGGRALGAWAGRVLRRARSRTRGDQPGRGRPHLADRILGGIGTFVVAGFVIVMLALSILSIGAPVASEILTRSVTVNALRSAVPEPVKQGLAWLLTVTDPFDDRVQSAPLLSAASVELPRIASRDEDHVRAALSVVLVTGIAIECRTSQYGTGFIVAPERVVTSAHVVAGVVEPVVTGHNEPARRATVVHFDPLLDLAVLAVPGLTGPPLSRGTTAEPSTDAVFLGHPHGGPLTLSAARVLESVDLPTTGIYDSSDGEISTHVFAGQVITGSSGGPLIDNDGHIIGMVYARAADNAPIGYALAYEHLAPLIEHAHRLTAPEGTQGCMSR